MRDLAVCGFTSLFLILALRSTFTAYLLWGWAGLVSLDAYLYGFMMTVPFVQIFAIITLSSMILRKNEGIQSFKSNRTTKWFIAFTIHGMLCALFAYPKLFWNWELFGNISKTVLFCILMPLLATSRIRLHALVVIAAMGIGFHGITEGLKFLASGGAHHAAGIAKFGDNNHFAMVLVMVLPILLYLAQYSAVKLVRLGFISALFITIFAVISTNSRGGLLGLLALSAWLILKSKRKAAGISVIFVCVILITQLAPDSWSDRMVSIQSATDDSSFMGRVTAWKVSSAIAVANPIFGGGFRAVQSPEVWAKFKDSQGLLGFVDTPETRSGVAAHSIWFEVLGDMGFVGLFLFVAMLVNAFLTLGEITSLVKRDNAAYRWAGDLSIMLGAALLVYVVSGSALSAAYFEWPYFVMMLLEVIKQILLKDSTPLAKIRGIYA